MNACLYKGLCLNPLLYDILLRFCVNNYENDIEKAYLQILVVPERRDYLLLIKFYDVYKNNPESIDLHMLFLVRVHRSFY